jgi:hypothetical protein
MAMLPASSSISMNNNKWILPYYAVHRRSGVGSLNRFDTIFIFLYLHTYLHRVVVNLTRE